MYSWHIFVHAFFQEFQSSSTVRGSHLHHAVFSSLIIPYLGIDGIKQPFRSHACHQNIDYFSRDYYPKPSYLSCHMGKKYLYLFWLPTPSLILPLQWYFLRTSKIPFTVLFYQQPSCIHLFLRLFTIGNFPSLTVPIFSTRGIHHHIHILNQLSYKIKCMYHKICFSKKIRHMP
jgi:hypothetical protein